MQKFYKSQISCCTEVRERGAECFHGRDMHGQMDPVMNYGFPAEDAQDITGIRYRGLGEILYEWALQHADVE